MEPVETDTLSAIDASDGREVRLSHASGIVSVRRRHKLGSRELRNRPLAQVSLVDAHTIDVDGAQYRVDSPEAASIFLSIASTSAGSSPSNAMPRELAQPLTPDADRWQYAVVNTGAFNTSERLATVLAVSGRSGWELVTIFDKSSNWLGGIEKGFMLLRRRVPPGVEPDNWAIQYRA